MGEKAECPNLDDCCADCASEGLIYDDDDCCFHEDE